MPRLNAIVVFGDQTTVSWLRILKPGFRHCFVLLEFEEGWVMLDSLAHWFHIAILPAVSVDELSAWYASRNYRVIVVQYTQPPKKPAPWAPFTCVETVKRALGIRRPWVWTPHQLWLFLK